MKSLLRSLPKLLMIILALSLLVVANAGGGEDFVPPVPDKSKTLPANDGGPDGCDSSRFDCVMGGEAVLDKQTGLVWARDINFRQKGVSWEDAVKFCQNFEIDGKTGWRLPTRDEFIAVLDTSQSTPAFPEGNPFILSREDLQGGHGGTSYWTSTEHENKESAWMVSLKFGKVYHSLKLLDLKVWPVRDSE